MKTSEDLCRLLISIDHRGYPAYKDTRGRWSYGNYILSIDHVQGDPFASPSNVSVIVPGRTALFPKEYMAPQYRLVTLEDMLLRSFSNKLRERDNRRRDDDRRDAGDWLRGGDRRDEGTQRRGGDRRDEGAQRRGGDRRGGGTQQRDGSGKSSLLARLITPTAR